MLQSFSGSSSQETDTFDDEDRERYCNDAMHVAGTHAWQKQKMPKFQVLLGGASLQDVFHHLSYN